jgi:hypothetical protein
MQAMATPRDLLEQGPGTSLSEDEATGLACETSRHVDGQADPEAAKMWADQIGRRARDVLDGVAHLVDGHDALTRVRAPLAESPILAV